MMKDFVRSVPVGATETATLGARLDHLSEQLYERLPSQKRLLCSICGDQRGARIGTTSGTCALTLVTTVRMAYFATKKVT